nr:YceI family protein [Spelaeicoccus albus]
MGSYADSENAAAARPLSQDSGRAARGPAPAIDGRWSTHTGSTAGYRVREALHGKNVTVVGRTDHVDGHAVASGSTVRHARLSVTLAAVHTNSKARDAYFRSQVINVDKHPRATFTLTEPINVGGLATHTGQRTVTAHGQLQLNGTRHAVTAEMHVVRKADSVTVSGAIPVTWTDYDVAPPNLGFVQVTDRGQVEFRAVLTKN